MPSIIHKFRSAVALQEYIVDALHAGSFIPPENGEGAADNTVYFALCSKRAWLAVMSSA